MTQESVLTQLDRLVEEVIKYQKEINTKGAKLLQVGNYPEVTLIIEKGVKITELLQNIQNLRGKWLGSINVPYVIDTKNERIPDQHVIKRQHIVSLKKGIRTSEKKFLLPILEALVELGGEAPMRSVLKIVERKMVGVFTQEDYNHLPSDEKIIRWENTAQWAKYTLLQTGLMSKDVPRGSWKITEDGRKVVLQKPKE